MSDYNDSSDLAQYIKFSRIEQPTSPELAPGFNKTNAQAGDIFVYFEDGTLKVFPRIPGVVFVPIFMAERWVEWLPGYSGSGPPVDVHTFEPADTHWPVVDTNGRKACLRSSNGNKIEHTYYLRSFVEEQVITLAFKSTALALVKQFNTNADRVRVEIDGDLVHLVGAAYNLSSEEQKKGTWRWYTPTFEQLGILGTPKGPSLDLARRAKALRQEFKAADAREKQERLQALGLRPPSLTANKPAHGSISFSSGVSKQWSDPKPSEQSPPAGKPDDSIPFA
jgi:hypothetical protein